MVRGETEIDMLVFAGLCSYRLVGEGRVWSVHIAHIQIRSLHS